jgi:hypothetical protein
LLKGKRQGTFGMERFWLIGESLAEGRARSARVWKKDLLTGEYERQAVFLGIVGMRRRARDSAVLYIWRSKSHFGN